MASLTFTLDEKLKLDMEHFTWVNWSEVNKEELNKKRIFEEFIKTGQLAKEDQKFCDKIDWYPVDELELKEEFVKKLKKKRKKSSDKTMTTKEFDKLCKEL